MKMQTLKTLVSLPEFMRQCLPGGIWDNGTRPVNLGKLFSFASRVTEIPFEQDSKGSVDSFGRATRVPEKFHFTRPLSEVEATYYESILLILEWEIAGETGGLVPWMDC